MSALDPPDRVAEELRLEAAVRDAARVGVHTMALRVATYGAGFVASVLLARALGPVGRGLYALPLAVLGIVMALAPLGIEHANFSLATRGVRAPVLWANATIAAAAISVVTAAVLVVLSLASPGTIGDLPGTWYLVVLAQVPVLLLILYWSSILQLEHRYRSVAAGLLLATAVHAAIVAALFAAGALTPFRVLALTWVVNGIACAWILSTGVRRGVAGWRPDPRALRQGVGFGLRVHGGAVSFFLLLRVDQVLVQELAGFRALGLYALAVAIAELLWLTCEPLAIAALPHQARADGGIDRPLAYATARLALVFAVAGGAILWIAAPFLIGLVYGSSFEDAATLLRWLLPGIVALSAARPLSTLLLRDGRPGLLSVLGFASLAVNVGLNVVLIGSIGAVGASIASSVAYVGLLGAYVVCTRQAGVVGLRDLAPRAVDLTRLVSVGRRRRPVGSPS
jgi:O-antigen/teichoic acid export membrane protein